MCVVELSFSINEPVEKLCQTFLRYVQGSFFHTSSHDHRLRGHSQCLIFYASLANSRLPAYSTGSTKNQPAQVWPADPLYCRVMQFF
jgi:hypothetical protein